MSTKVARSRSAPAQNTPTVVTATDVPDRLSDSDLKLWHRAQATVAAAAAVLQFAQAHITTVYDLKANDQVDDETGDIARAPVVAPRAPNRGQYLTREAVPENGHATDSAAQAD